MAHIMEQEEDLVEYQPSPEAQIPHLKPELKMGANIDGVDILRGGEEAMWGWGLANKKKQNTNNHSDVSMQCLPALVLFNL